MNVAGVVDFNPPLDEALDANAFGAQNLVGLTRRIGLDGSWRDVRLLHTSTCYVAGTPQGAHHRGATLARALPARRQLGAGLWDPQREIAECLDLVAQAKHRAEDAFRQSEFSQKAKKTLEIRGEPAHGEAFDRELSRVKRRFVADRLVEAGQDRAKHWGWPNIYTYTKSIGEQVIAESGLPFTIVRPACCESTVSYPVPGCNEGIKRPRHSLTSSSRANPTFPASTFCSISSPPTTWWPG